MTEQTISIERMEEAVNLFGSFDENIRIIERELSVAVVSRDGELKVSGEGEDVLAAVQAINGLLTYSSRGEQINEQNVRYILQLVRSGNADKIGELAGDALCVTAKGKPIKAKTIGQKRYVEAIRKNTVTLGIGPAGTGKTYLAVAAAVAAFRAKEVNRIILTRPAVEAGERLGFLPGDLQSKVDPYLRPLYDGLFAHRSLRPAYRTGRRTEAADRGLPSAAGHPAESPASRLPPPPGGSARCGKHLWP